MRSEKATAQTKIPKTLPGNSSENHLDTSSLDPLILNRDGLSAALNDRKERLGW